MPIDMQKRTAIAKMSLIKVLEDEAAKGNDLGDLTAQIKLVIDYSSSMGQFYLSGQMQELAERVLALSLTGLDADGSVDIYPFDNQSYEPFTVTTADYKGCIERWRQEEVTETIPGKSKMFGKREPDVIRTFIRERQMGGTNYAPVIERIRQDARSAGDLAPGKPPVIVFFQTDGGTMVPDLTQATLTESANQGEPIFWEFIGLGNNTGFLDVLNLLPGRKIDNVGKVSFTSISSVSDEDFYAGLTSEVFPKWLPEARAQGIVTV